MSESIEVKQLRSRLGSYMNQVQEGLTVIVTRQGQAIAELRPYGVEQAGQDAPDVPNWASQEPSGEPQDEAVPMIEGMSALGLTTYVCQTEQASPMMVPDEESEEAGEDISPEQAMPELQAPEPEQVQESQPKQVMQTEMAAVAVEVESAAADSPSPAKPAKSARPSRSRKAKTAASPKRRQSRGASARKKSS